MSEAQAGGAAYDGSVSTERTVSSDVVGMAAARESAVAHVRAAKARVEKAKAHLAGAEEALEAAKAEYEGMVG